MSAADRRERLLDVTKAIVDRQGFHAVSIEAVAREAGITRPIVYGHFRDLPGLLEALVEREATGRSPSSTSCCRGTWRPATRASCSWPRRRPTCAPPRRSPRRWKLVLMPQEGAPASMRERIAEGREQVVAQLAQAVAPLFQAGSGGPDPELTALMLSTMADEAVRLLLNDPGAIRRAARRRDALGRRPVDRPSVTSANPDRSGNLPWSRCLGRGC